MAEMFDPAGGHWSGGALTFDNGLAVETLTDLDRT